MTIPTQQQYEFSELQRFQREMAAIEKLPLTERKEGKEKLKELTNHIDRFEHLSRLLIDGSYGAGAKFAFEMLTKRMNRRAWLFITIGMIECRTSNKYARDVWNELTPEKQAEINKMLDEVIAEHDEDNKE